MKYKIPTLPNHQLSTDWRKYFHVGIISKRHLHFLYMTKSTKAHLQVLNVGNVLPSNQLLVIICKLTQVYCVLNVGNFLVRYLLLLNIREFTQVRSHFHVLNVGNVLVKNQILQNI
ncbi:hypothetical protein GDO78_022952 [Eleutherodactylus coqui]|uniref:Uncharacterized protein n=1 Tax=Eleutherodactylus coqui TaxID=57060 RepID=A0A8J6JU32_ELECQ|nr:hypothetical protein GDO78_022952 [Eleutherodactylus coqui]